MHTGCITTIIKYFAEGVLYKLIMIFIHFKALIKDSFGSEYFKAVGDYNALLQMSHLSQTANKNLTARISLSKQLKTL